jgi:vesicle-fusing ATPase
MFSWRRPDEPEAHSDEHGSRGGAPWLDDLLAGSQLNEAYVQDFSATVGGLRPQIETIVRRVLDGRVVRPADEIPGSARATVASHPSGGGHVSCDPFTAQQDAEVLAALGLAPVRGLLLHGPPGTGKTLLAREISRALRARAPKIVAAPELLDRWVGGSEKAVRSLFADAEAELASVQGDPTKSALHVIVIDEIDAVFRHRSGAAGPSSGQGTGGASSDSGEATRSSVVNQILAKLDGVNAVPNVLLVGMTNRRELIDSALLRPGRLEVQIEIPLPSQEGRREILQIHFGPLRRQGRLSEPLCRAIDGPAAAAAAAAPPSGKRERLFRAVAGAGRGRWRIPPAGRSRPVDLAAATPGYSGADLAGLVRCAGSLALARARKDGTGVSGLFVTLDDVRRALDEVSASRN